MKWNEKKYNRRPRGRYNRDVDGPNKRRGMKNKAEAHEKLIRQRHCGITTTKKTSYTRKINYYIYKYCPVVSLWANDD